VHSALRNNRLLLEAAADELARLRFTLAGTSTTAILTDAQGVVIGTSYSGARSHEQLMPVSTRIGVNLAEDAVGTNAPGITARSGRPCVVMGAEHYFGNAQVMHCAAAPIRDVRGQLAGVLDLSSEGISFSFDSATVVGHYATVIENRLLRAQCKEHLVLHLHIMTGLLDTPMVALVGITGDGRIDWLNGAALRLLGLPGAHGSAGPGSVEDLLGLAMPALVALASRSEPQALQLPNGLTLWARCEWRTPDGPRARREHAAVMAPAAVQPKSNTAEHSPASTLRDAERQTVERVLGECDGNVSRAARQLGVSRGLIYRQLRKPKT
jgi:sigma-54 dependent transcriptional regulator, acetoin dehydrogenase operon transcriptional activator AcoR